MQLTVNNTCWTIWSNFEQKHQFLVMCVHWEQEIHLRFDVLPLPTSLVCIFYYCQKVWPKRLVKSLGRYSINVFVMFKSVTNKNFSSRHLFELWKVLSEWSFHYRGVALKAAFRENELGRRSRSRNNDPIFSSFLEPRQGGTLPPASIIYTSEA